MNQRMMILSEKPNITNWDVENGYSNSESNNTDRSYLMDYPRRVFGVGHQTSLAASFRTNEHNIVHPCNQMQGFLVFVHNPFDMSQLSRKFINLNVDEEISLSIKPNMITTSEGLRHYDPNRRGCYFVGERELRFFKIYTQDNCELECVSNSTERRCGCVKFSYPSKQKRIKDI